MVYFQNHYSIQEPVLDSILLYFAVFITRTNKEIQTHRILVVLLRQYTGSYSRHMQSWIYPYLVQIQENTVPKVPLQVSIGTFLENQVFVVFLIEGYEYAALKKERLIAPFLEHLLLWQKNYFGKVSLINFIIAFKKKILKHCIFDTFYVQGVLYKRSCPSILSYSTLKQSVWVSLTDTFYQYLEQSV